MCEKCVELDNKIEHYGPAVPWITDQKDNVQNLSHFQD